MSRSTFETLMVIFTTIILTIILAVAISVVIERDNVDTYSETMNSSLIITNIEHSSYMQPIRTGKMTTYVHHQYYWIYLMDPENNIKDRVNNQELYNSVNIGSEIITPKIIYYRVEDDSIYKISYPDLNITKYY